MIYEVRTYDLKPRALAEVEQRFGEAYEHRKKYSELAAFWHTEIGPLNQIIHVWGYKNLDERVRVRGEAVKDKNWPPKIAEFIVGQRSEIMIPFPAVPEMKPGRQGPCFEMRTYTYFAGHLPKIMSIWEAALPVRLQFGPITGLMYSELGNLNRFIHIWPYKTLDERQEIRKKAQATGNWPPSAHDKNRGGSGYDLLAQENKIVMPSAFSPIQ
ncbi:MAG: NIPSNAP family protein [Candidatus Lambdaproteobacteria bacterium]|nr:NIPSNAP family protein [Candidatus Lambdaproteobacteria bacterium]